MSHEYFGERVHIYGIDIDPQCRAYEHPGVRVFIGDQADPEFWRGFLMEVPTLDIVVDDGGHQAHQQRATLGGASATSSARRSLTYVRTSAAASIRSWTMCTTCSVASTLSTGTARGVEPTEFQQWVDSIHLYPFVVVVEKRAQRLEHLPSERRGTEWQPRRDRPSRSVR